jgi:thioredoxin-related protein
MTPAWRFVARRRLLARAALACLAAGAGAHDAARASSPDDTMLGGPSSYVPEARLASERGEPLLLFFSLEGCVYCEALRAEQLRHVHARRETLGVRLVEMRIDDDRPIPGLEPARSPRQVAAAMKVRIAPTLLFLHGEREVAERLVGYSNQDFYGAYLDERIATARAASAARGPSR